MSRFPNEDAQTAQARRLQEWWLGLPLAYRVNALLYALGGLALVFLLVTLLSDDGRNVQVGAGIPTTVATTVPRAVTTRAQAVTTSPSSSSTSSVASSSSAPTTAPAASPTTARAPTPTSPSQTSGTTRPPDTTAPTTTATTAAPTTTAPPNCRNSSHPACGAFLWDPAPAANAPLVTSAEPLKPSYKVGEQVFFKVTVSDPDHVVNENCSEVRFDNGAAADGPCNPPPDCPPRHGPWTPPSPVPGSHTANYINVWTTPGQHTATFRFRSWSPSTCLALDPYASEGQTVTATVNITE